VPIPHQENSSAGAGTTNHPTHLALRSLGGWTSWVYSLECTIDKFTKWAEVQPVRTIPARSAVKFIRGLVCHFFVPNLIITDNGS
jgi:hypothetical protein